MAFYKGYILHLHVWDLKEVPKYLKKIARSSSILGVLPLASLCKAFELYVVESGVILWLLLLTR